MIENHLEGYLKKLREVCGVADTSSPSVSSPSVSTPSVTTPAELLQSTRPRRKRRNFDPDAPDIYGSRRSHSRRRSSDRNTEASPPSESQPEQPDEKKSQKPSTRPSLSSAPHVESTLVDSVKEQEARIKRRVLIKLLKERDRERAIAAGRTVEDDVPGDDEYEPGHTPPTPSEPAFMDLYRLYCMPGERMTLSELLDKRRRINEEVWEIIETVDRERYEPVDKHETTAAAPPDPSLFSFTPRPFTTGPLGVGNGSSIEQAFPSASIDHRSLARQRRSRRTGDQDVEEVRHRHSRY